MKFLTPTLVLLLVLAIPATTFARHNERNDYGRGDYGIDRDDLDDDIVKDIPIPILFGLVYKNIRSDFGDPRGGGTRLHEGQDIFAPEGTPIVSPTEAIVIRTGEDAESAGNYVYTANPGGETFRYMHLKDVANLDPGDKLDAGDYIGTVGDTGNAKGTPYHLHFEMRDEDNEAQDPYPRLEGEFTFKEKASFLEGIFKGIKSDEKYAEFLVENFSADFKAMVKAKYNLPSVLEDVLEEKGIVSEATAHTKLTTLFEGLPALIPVGVKDGQTGPSATLLQMYLIFTTEGPARNTLAAAGPTGYFGPASAAALREYQTLNKLPVTGVYDAATKTHMTKRTSIELQIK
jgi:Peptidase family M23/Putative peptidoglycan binding domain